MSFKDTIYLVKCPRCNYKAPVKTLRADFKPLNELYKSKFKDWLCSTCQTKTTWFMAEGEGFYSKNELDTDLKNLEIENCRNEIGQLKKKMHSMSGFFSIRNRSELRKSEAKLSKLEAKEKKLIDLYEESKGNIYQQAFDNLSPKSRPKCLHCGSNDYSSVVWHYCDGNTSSKKGHLIPCEEEGGIASTASAIVPAIYSYDEYGNIKLLEKERKYDPLFDNPSSSLNTLQIQEILDQLQQENTPQKKMFKVIKYHNYHSHLAFVKITGSGGYRKSIFFMDYGPNEKITSEMWHTELWENCNYEGESMDEYLKEEAMLKEVSVFSTIEDAESDTKNFFKGWSYCEE